jgi:hypothetical protein
MAAVDATSLHQHEGREDKISTHLVTRPDRERLRQRGVIKSKEADDMAKLRNSALSSMLDQKLAIRPDREVLEAKGKLKDKETHESQKAAKAAQARQLESALLKRPEMDALARRGVLSDDEVKMKRGQVEKKLPVHDSLLEAALRLEGKLDRQQERHRLETKGILHPRDVKRAAHSEAKASLETKLTIRPDREVLESKGRLKDLETHEAQKAEKKQVAASLERQLQRKPQRQAVERKGLIKEASEEVTFEKRKDWRNHAEVVFNAMDLDCNGFLDKHELHNILGNQASALIRTLVPGDTGAITEKTWMDHCSKIEEKEGHEALVAFIKYAETQLAKYAHSEASRRHNEVSEQKREDAAKAEQQAMLTSLDNHLMTRPPREHLEARGKIKTKEDHAAELQDKEKAKSDLESKLVLSPAAMGRREGHTEAFMLVEDRTPHEYDWRNAAEHVFYDLDINMSNSLDKWEVQEIFGDAASPLLLHLQVSETGEIELPAWMAHIDRLYRSHGVEAAQDFIKFAKFKVREYKQDLEEKKEARRVAARKRTASQSADYNSAASALERRLGMQPEKERLEARGLIKDSHAEQVQRMNKAAAAAALESKLSIRPEREHLEARGRIKDIDTHEAQKAERRKAAADLEKKLKTQPSRSLLQGAGKLKLQFDPRSDPVLIEEIFNRHTIPTGLSYLELDKPPFRAAIVEVCAAFDVSLDVDAIVKDAIRELQIPPDLEGFFEVLDVAEALIDVYLK